MPSLSQTHGGGHFLMQGNASVPCTLATAKNVFDGQMQSFQNRLLGLINKVREMRKWIIHSSANFEYSYL